LTVKVWPPMVTVPLRAPPVFAATFNVTVPLPLPVAPLVTVIHVALLVAGRAHPLGAVTVTLTPVVPAAGTAADVGCSDTVHVGVPAGACWIVTDSSPTVIVPVRPVPELLATVKLTLALPEPPAGATVIQPTVLDAAHAQPAGVATVTTPAPPAAENWLPLTLISS
jgi:hypothetical protein